MVAAPRLSVVMTVRNVEPYVREAIDSILGQTFADFEFIIVDDGSTDRTWDLVSSYGDARIRPRRQPPQGIVAAANAALAVARAGLVARMDGDDIALPARFQRQIDHLDRHPDIAALGTALIEIDTRGIHGRTIRFPPTPAAIRALPPSATQIVAQGTAIVRRAALDAVGGYRPMFELSEDLDLWLRLAERFDLANLDEPLLLYRQHPTQITQSRQTTRRASSALAGFLAAERRAGRGEAEYLSGSLAASCLAAARAISSRPAGERPADRKLLINLLEGAKSGIEARTAVNGAYRRLVLEALWTGDLRQTWRTLRSWRRPAARIGAASDTSRT